MYVLRMYTDQKITFIILLLKQCVCLHKVSAKTDCGNYMFEQNKKTLWLLLVTRVKKTIISYK
jgi:hypothetical protein